MSDKQKETYPVIPAKHWWALRARFQKSIPATVSAGFIATTLRMLEKSAKTNIIPSLVMMGIIDPEGKPTERAKRWRDDLQYAEVCREIRSECYPQELLDAAPGPTVDRAAVERWFANRTGAGTVAVRRFSLVYELLANATVPGKRARPAERRQPVKPKPVEDTLGESVPGVETHPVLLDLVPSVHIDIQIHISPDAKPEQIDQIFASIAKHLRK